MPELTTEQRLYFKQHKIPLSNVFNASGLRTMDWKAQMKEEGKGFAFGTTPCSKGGHTLRTRAGHCIQCNTENIAYYQRHRASGYVYIAGSMESRQLKIGMTTDLNERTTNLNIHRYGGAGDWEILASAHSTKAGEHEFSVHQLLAQHATKSTYVKAGRTYDCHETFGCKFIVALDALRKALPAETPLRVMHKDRAMKYY